MELWIGAGLACVGIAVGLGQWLIPPEVISLKIKAGLIIFACSLAVIGVGLIVYAVIPHNQIPMANPPKQDQSRSQLVVESMPSSATIVLQGNQPCSAKVAKLAGLKVKNVGGVRITNVGLVVLKTNDFIAPFQPQLPVSTIDVFFNCPNPQPVQVSVDLNPGDDAVFGAVIECNGTYKCLRGKLGLPYVDRGEISFYFPVIANIERFDKFTVRASGDGVSAVTKQFEVKLTTDGSLALESGVD